MPEITSSFARVPPPRSSALLAVLAALATASVAYPAAAQDPAACVAAASKAQKLRNAHKLVEARVELRVCAASTCPSVVQSDCVPWLAEVERVLPGVVVAAKDASGADLIDVKVTVDGDPFLTKLDGQAVPIDAGAHTFHFETASGATLDRQVVVREGDKGQTIAVVLGPAAGAPPTPGAAPGDAQPAGGRSSTLRTVGWALGGVGAAGVVIGLISGIVAVSDKGSAHCANNVCDPGTVSGIKSAALVADIGWIGGGVLLAGGAGILLFGPKGDSSAPPSSPPPNATFRLSPIFTPGGGGLVAGGSF